jgi:hypothetical protein
MKKRKKLVLKKVTISNLTQIEMKESAGGNTATCVACGTKYSVNTMCHSICSCDTFTCDTFCSCDC